MNHFTMNHYYMENENNEQGLLFVCLILTQVIPHFPTKDTTIPSYKPSVVMYKWN